MIEDHTVFILGAGASMPYGYPSGEELRNIIIDNLRQNRSNRAEIVNLDLGFSESEVMQFADDLAISNTYTIDEFLDSRNDMCGIGKVAIAQALIPKEDRNVLLTENNSQHWYRILNRHLRTSSFDDFNRNKVKIITFNYDRSLEEYLFNTQRALQGNNFKAEILKEFPILHIFGKLGDLNWENPEGRAYDSDLSTGEYLKSAAEGIRTLHEDDANVLYEAEKLIDWADEIYFLGFGYDITNLQRLNVFNLIERKHPINMEMIRKKVVGTAFGLSNTQKGRIKQFFDGRIGLGDHNDDCVIFLKKYGFE